MNDNYLINVIGTQTVDGETDSIEVITSGDYTREENGDVRIDVAIADAFVGVARLAHELGISLFATTLSSSRWKRLDQISEAGRAAALPYPDVDFLDRNWRKGGLQERRNILLKENGFYNQQYCGCEFSFRPNEPSNI